MVTANQLQEVFLKEGYDDVDALRERAQAGQDEANLLAKQLVEDQQLMSSVRLF